MAVIKDGKLVMKVPSMEQQFEPGEDTHISDAALAAQDEIVDEGEQQAAPHQDEGQSPYAEENEEQQIAEEVREPAPEQQPRGQNIEDLPEDVRSRLAFNDEMMELAEKHPAITIEWARARIKEGRPVARALQELVAADDARRAAPVADAKTGQVQQADDILKELGVTLTPEQENEFYAKVKTGNLAAATLYLTALALKPVRETMTKEERAREERRKADESAAQDAQFHEGMLNLARVHSEFFDVSKGGKTAYFKQTKEGQALGAKMKEVAQRNGMPKSTPLNIVADIALAELGWLGNKPRQQQPQQRQQQRPQQQPQRRAPVRGGRPVVKDGMLTMFVPRRG